MSFGPASPDAGVELLRQLFLQCNVNIVYVKLISENSQDFAQKPKRNCTFMNTASGYVGSICAEEFGKEKRPPIRVREKCVL